MALPPPATTCVLLAPQSSRRPLAARLGLRFVTLAGDMAAELDDRHAVGGARRRPGARSAASSRGFAQRHTGGWMRTVLEAARGTDVILPAGLAVYVGLSVAEHLRVPVVGIGLQPVMPTGDFPVRVPAGLAHAALGEPAVASAGARLDVARVPRRDERGPARRIGSGRAGAAEWKGYPILFGISPTLMPRPRDWPERYEVTGHWTTPIDPALAARCRRSCVPRRR